MLAGSMYESGVCLKQDWLKAQSQHRAAHQAGEGSAIGRMIAGAGGASRWRWTRCVG
jgi:hypothetical protein